jgi:dihydrofolate reductase
MGKIVISENVTLDGGIQDPVGEEGWDRGGWFFETARGDDGDRFTLDEAVGAEAWLLGRRSYEFFASRWPSREGEIADRLNSMPKYVVSSTLEEPEWANTTVLTGDVLEAVSRLKAELDGEIVVVGSFQLGRTLIENDLVDGLRAQIYPVVLGAGERLFDELSAKLPLRLVDSTTVGDGIVILDYEVVREA